MEDVDATGINHHQSSSLLIVSPVQNFSESQNEENNCQGEIQIDRERFVKVFLIRFEIHFGKSSRSN
ncbi:unnamed protein product [Adineta steineri]|uniref:Uncharacterized protein n=1 Tax=Adineta steineri TaxID=433720 RepID=A0A815BQR0_9BILA|nr:unnamed protein product [Adineta steineri]CAF1560851.1 unnamed protein product [Adineta steineri]